MRVFLGLILSTSFAMAQVKVEAAAKVEGAKFRPFVIAVADSNDSTILPIVRSDLTLSGMFKVLPTSSFIAKPSEEVGKKQIKWEDWTNIGAEGLVKTRITNSGSKVKVLAYLYTVGKLGKSKEVAYETSQADYKTIAHQISNDIYEFFTGEPGIFLSKIAAIKKVDGNYQLVTMDMDGKNEKVVMSDDTVKLLPSFAPDRKSILFTRIQKEGHQLCEIKTDGSRLKVLSKRPGVNSGGVVSPDGKRIALTLSQDNDSEIYLLDRTGGNPKRLTNSPGIDTSPSFSPDGKQIAFVSVRQGNPQIYTMNIDGSNVTRLTFQGKYNQTPRYSPKGDLILFTGRDEHKVFDIFSYDIASKTISRITQNQGGNEDPWFGPNGRVLIFTSTRDGRHDLYLSNVDGTSQQRIAQGEYMTPTFGP